MWFRGDISSLWWIHSIHLPACLWVAGRIVLLSVCQCSYPEGYRLNQPELNLTKTKQLPNWINFHCVVLLAKGFTIFTLLPVMHVMGLVAWLIKNHTRWSIPAYTSMASNNISIYNVDSITYEEQFRNFVLLKSFRCGMYVLLMTADNAMVCDSNSNSNSEFFYCHRYIDIHIIYIYYIYWYTATMRVTKQTLICRSIRSAINYYLSCGI